jgi:hypothetical protein
MSRHVIVLALLLVGAPAHVQAIENTEFTAPPVFTLSVTVKPPSPPALMTPLYSSFAGPDSPQCLRPHGVQVRNRRGGLSRRTDSARSPASGHVDHGSRQRRDDVGRVAQLAGRRAATLIH